MTERACPTTSPSRIWGVLCQNHDVICAYIHVNERARSLVLYDGGNRICALHMYVAFFPLVAARHCPFRLMVCWFTIRRF